MTSVAKLLGPGGGRTVIAESLAVKHQLLILNRFRRRAPNLSTLDRILLGFGSLFLSPRRICRVAVIIRPATLQRFHDALKKRNVVQGYDAGRHHWFVRPDRRRPRVAGRYQVAGPVDRGLRLRRDILLHILYINGALLAVS